MYQTSGDNSVWLRLLRPRFKYPDGGFKHPDALYYPSEDAVFIVTKSQPSKYGDNVYTELSTWKPDEIRLLGALTLAGA